MGFTVGNTICVTRAGLFTNAAVKPTLHAPVFRRTKSVVIARKQLLPIKNEQFLQDSYERGSLADGIKPGFREWVLRAGPLFSIPLYRPGLL